MMRNWLVLLIVVVSFQVNFAQELNPTVSVNADRMTDVNPQIFKNLEKQVTEFLNNTKWTNREYKPFEKIDCNFFINVSEFNSNNILATLQIQSSRIVFNSTYTSPVLNLNDKDFKPKVLKPKQSFKEVKKK